jgi:hypothetical protein
MTAILTAVAIVAMATILYQMSLFDRLIRWEYEHHRDQWERDGKPDGYFWRAGECKFWSSDMAKKRLTGVWLFKTPGWVATSPECRRWLAQTRVICLMSMLAVSVLLARLLLTHFVHHGG